jgi:low temperature requirement protein LtrA
MIPAMEATTRRMGTAEPEAGDELEPQVSPLELFFDLVFVFAFTQVTGLMAANPTWEGLGEGMLVLAAVWWAWGGYAWMTNALASDDGIARLGLLSAMAAMLIAALAIPEAFGNDAVVFGLAYFAVRAIHIAVYASTGLVTIVCIVWFFRSFGMPNDASRTAIKSSIGGIAQ